MNSSRRPGIHSVAEALDSPNRSSTPAVAPTSCSSCRLPILLSPRWFYFFDHTRFGMGRCSIAFLTTCSTTSMTRAFHCDIWPAYSAPAKSIWCAGVIPTRSAGREVGARWARATSGFKSAPNPGLSDTGTNPFLI